MDYIPIEELLSWAISHNNATLLFLGVNFSLSLTYDVT